MDTQQIEGESTDEKHLRECCNALTNLNVEIPDAENALAQHLHENPIPTAAVRARAFELEGALERLRRARQDLLLVYGDLKSKVNGWS